MTGPEQIVKNILITRPLHQSGGLSECVKKLGGNPLIFPTLEIIPVHENNYFAEVGKNLSQYQTAIFTSANAVDCCLPFWTMPLPKIDIIAIGPGTAEALKKYRLPRVIVPDSHCSEGILELEVVQTVLSESRGIVIFCGENPRALLRETLIARGYAVTEIFCYRRQLPAVNAAEKLTTLKNQGIDLIVSTSLESLNNLWQLFVKLDREWLQNIPLLVISPGMTLKAQQLGFKLIIEADGASDAAISAKLEHLKSMSCL